MCGAIASLTVIREPVLAGLHEYWSGKSHDGRLPGRASIAPEEMVPYLPHVMLVDVLDGGRSLRLRLVGTAIAAGLDPTGRILQDALPPGEYRDHLLGLYAAVLEQRAPLFTRHLYDFGGGSGRCNVARMFMPLAADGSTVDMLLVGQVRHDVRSTQYIGWHGQSVGVVEIERTLVA